MKYEDYKAIIRRLKKRYNGNELRAAMDAVVETAIKELQSGCLSEREYGQICVRAAYAAYPKEGK